MIREMAKKDAIKKNDQEELDEDVNEIEGMSKKLHKKHHTSHKKPAKHSHNVHHTEADSKELDRLDSDGDNTDNTEEKETSSHDLLKKASKLKKEITQVNNNQKDKKTNHVHVKKNKIKPTKTSGSKFHDKAFDKAYETPNTGATMASSEDADAEAEIDEPIAHEKEPEIKSNK